MSETEALEVRLEDLLLEGWKSVRISRAFDRLAASFALELAEISPLDPLARALTRGEVVDFFVGERRILSGRVYRRRKSYDGTSNRISVSGRDVVADLVDSSAVNEPGQWTGARVDTIAAELVGLFPGLRYRADLSVSGLGSADHSLQTGETVFASLDRLARMRGLVVASDLEGGVYFTRPGLARAPVTLERGVNIERGDLSEDESGRFSRYIVHGQAPNQSYWDTGGSPGLALRAESRDPDVRSVRPRVIQAEAARDEGSLQARADFEASVNAARSVSVGYSLPGWTLEGHFWEPGELVAVWDPVLEVGTEALSPVDLLVGSVDLSRDASGGSSTALQLHAPGAFAPAPPTPPENEAQPFWE